MAEEKNENQNCAEAPMDGSTTASPPEEQGGARQKDFDIKVDGVRDTVIGDGASIHHNYGLFSEDIRKILKEQRESTVEVIVEVMKRFPGVGARDDFIASLKYRREKVVADQEMSSATSSIDDPVELPKTIDELEEWYDALDDHEQCFVQAVTVLHGAPLLDISAAAVELSQALEAGVTSQDESNSQDSASARSSRRMLRRTRLKRTCVTTSRIHYVERTFWRSTDVQEQQTFTLRMFRFISEEFALAYHPASTTRFTDILKAWAENKSGECARKAARGLGIVLFHQNVDELWRVANSWANSPRPDVWRLAAEALNGAYDIHKLEEEEKVNDIRKSPIFRLLNQWVERAENGANPRVGCAAANVYGHISYKVPDIALNGLERLLCLPDSGADSDWKSISVFVWVESISNYIGLAWSGHIRKVLDHLAVMIEKIIYQRQRPDKIGERQKYRDRCILNIEAIFNIFFPVALSSLIGMRDNIPVTYTTSEPLPDCPEIPDEQGKDILLAGILTEAEPHWYQCLATLLCAATFAGKARDASFFMRQWAEIILQENTVEHEQLEAIYLQFVVHVGTMINEWENDLTRMRLGPLPAYRTFRHTITLWPDKRHPRPIDSFVQKVLQALDARICLHAHMKGD